MSMPDAQPPRPMSAMILRVAVRLAVLLGVLAAVLFGSAGRLDWAAAWWFIGSYGVFLALYAAWGLFRDPEQLRERGREAPNVKGWDRVIIRVYGLLLPALFVLTGLDAGRFGWSSPPAGVRAASWIGLLAAASWIFWVLMTNTFLSRMVRIQDDRGHRVVTSGPYRYVRHPMYAGLVVFFVCIPLALGSWWGLVVSALIIALFVLRTALEDRTLRQELDGYDEYARRVCYRLLPGVW
jgi:protein-S-isoprenylcysteine O-methyltransferase Ste14